MITVGVVDDDAILVSLVGETALELSGEKAVEAFFEVESEVADERSVIPGTGG